MAGETVLETVLEVTAVRRQRSTALGNSTSDPRMDGMLVGEEHARSSKSHVCTCVHTRTQECGGTGGNSGGMLVWLIQGSELESQHLPKTDKSPEQK